MSLSNTASHYGSVTKTFHWLTALLVLTLIPLGIYANSLPFDTSEQLARKAWLFSLHKTLGVTVFFVALARIVWALSQPKPGLLHPDRKVESLAAETVHWLLYGSLLLVPLSGWVHHAATDGFAPIWWPLGQSLPLVPKSETVAAVTAGLHIVFERVLAASILLHVAGAVKHHVIDKDATLRRMLPGRPEVAATGGGHRIVAPVTSAVAIWISALFVGNALGLYAAHGPTVSAAALEDVQSDWQVQEGEITITVRQLGTNVQGSFADWTSAISFDEDVTAGTAGTVETTVSIGSLTLGSVTSQALGADYFNAEAFPTAVFVAEILRSESGYEAQGTLTMKDTSVPVTLPFTLEISGDVATMTGSATLDRRNYGIGDNQKDEGTLGFNVAVNISLTATRAEQ
ncbi:cytochrome b/b6 domain-containing protein [Roseobacter sp. YSTF-M11]|uniref:Cytochrome b/b6 domain-containing protein n=1 Tax=Roseobacter insulae TaxID=2859783 RepID=A0A9X1FVS9_9RHOB|nr:cytochrome b/b6 domain-containing protein [Roseobacter insulae]MBW4708521.1 cytochrome b/b6 domain-containing protein [Roseobacter insulae]